MIRRNGGQDWNNVHVTEKTTLDDLIDVDNSVVTGAQLTGLALLKRIAQDMDFVVQEARATGKRVRALGSGWALTDIAVTDGWLINTKLLNGCFDVPTELFDPSYSEAKQPYVVVAQCGVSIGELNVHLEVTATTGFPRALKTSGIGAGQTIAGAISGNTHGAAVNFGSTPDYVVGIQLATGRGTSWWLERASYPVMNADFVEQIGAQRLRDDDIFDAAVVSFGAFGIITAVAIETLPLYQLDFRRVRDISHADLKRKLSSFDPNDPPDLYHYEFVFDPHSKNQMAMEALATKVPFEGGYPAPHPLWIVRNYKGFAPGDRIPKLLLNSILGARKKTAIQFAEYRSKCILDNIRCTPGQAFMATITYLEGYNELAMGISITDASQMIDISTAVIKRMRLPAMSQVRIVHPSRALLAFTSLGPKTAVFEFGLANDSSFGRFANSLIEALTRAGVAYTLHWSKNSGIAPSTLETMYGAPRISRWREARRRVFDGDTSLMRVFENGHLTRSLTA